MTQESWVYSSTIPGRSGDSWFERGDSLSRNLCTRMYILNKLKSLKLAKMKILWMVVKNEGGGDEGGREGCIEDGRGLR